MMGRVATLWLSLALAGSASAGPQIGVEPESFDFGEARQQSTLHKEFRLVNLGDADLEIGRVSTSCGCTATQLAERVIPPGSSEVLRVSVDTRSDRGRIQRTVIVSSNDPERPRLRIQLSVDVVAEP
jgi:hypothetical protein